MALRRFDPEHFPASSLPALGLVAAAGLVFGGAGADVDGIAGGAGEAAHGPVTAAIANAVFDALGVRVRDLPITRDRIVAAMEST